MIFGSIPALVTPFTPDGAFDEPAFRELVEWQITEGSTALVVCGTTGETATLNPEEHFDIVRVCVMQVRGRVPVIAGTGSNDTRVAIRNLSAAKDAGADAALVHIALFTDASPGPVKYALSLTRSGFPQALRLPMTPPSETSRVAVRAALVHAALMYDPREPSIGHAESARS